MSAPVFVYYMELNVHLVTLFNTLFFPLKGPELFGCGLVLLAHLERVYMLSEVSNRQTEKTSLYCQSTE